MFKYDNVLPKYNLIVMLKGNSSLFNTIYVCLDTIFLCFCEDCEKNDGVDKPYFMSKVFFNYIYSLCQIYEF
jgi:hypothetical protein